MAITCEVPIFYATTEGQTCRIATYLAYALRKRGVDSVAIDMSSPAAEQINWSAVRAAIVGASLHGGKHQRAAGDFVKAHAGDLNGRPSAFFSVSLSAGSKQARVVEAARRLAEAFPSARGWQPDRVVCFAGRLAYTKYGFFKRFIMKKIARKEGAPVDTSRDYEFTNWADVTAFAVEMKRLVEVVVVPTVMTGDPTTAIAIPA
jgi:menaquinone-dependent protoporphyrinogen oxidase